MADDLKALKAELRSWEKSFKLKNSRDPSKADIKENPKIAGKYKLYSQQRLQANGGIKPEGAIEPAKGSSTDLKRKASQSILTAGSSSKDGPSIPKLPRNSEPATSSSSVVSAESSTSAATFQTPTKTKSSSRTGNPFASPSNNLKPTSLFSALQSEAANINPLRPNSPLKVSVSRPPPPVPTSPFGSNSSFHFATSPNKLKKLVSAHSSTGVPNDALSLREGWTPRTKARKRLRGEVVGETPVKVGKKRRGDYFEEKEGGDYSSEEREEDEDEVLGPTPAKPSASQRTTAEDIPFKPIFSFDDDEDDSMAGTELVPGNAVKKRGPTDQPSKVTTLFGKGKKVVPQQTQGNKTKETQLLVFKAPGIPASKTNGFVKEHTPAFATTLTINNKSSTAFITEATDSSDEPLKAKSKLTAVKTKPSAKALAKFEELDKDGDETAWMNDDSDLQCLNIVASSLVGRKHQQNESTMVPSILLESRKPADKMRDGNGEEAQDLILSEEDEDVTADLMIFHPKLHSPQKSKDNIVSNWNVPVAIPEGGSVAMEAVEDDSGEDDEESATQPTGPSILSNTTSTTVIVPPHLLSALSLQSPSSQRRLTYHRKKLAEETVNDIFSFRDQLLETMEQEPEDGVELKSTKPTKGGGSWTKGKGKGRGKWNSNEPPEPLPPKSTLSFKATVELSSTISNPFASSYSLQKPKKPKGLPALRVGEGSWGLNRDTEFAKPVDLLEAFMGRDGEDIVLVGDEDGEDDDWASDVEGWKAGGGDNGDEDW